MKKKNKTLDKFLNILGYIFIMLPFILLGAYAAEASNALVPDADGAEVGKELVIMGATIIIGFLFYLLHIIFHEGGHLICGLIKGYKFLSFRVGSLTLVKREGKLQWKKTTVAGTGGQCLMLPPECEPESCPFTLYLWGGGLMNLILGIIGTLIAMPLDGFGEVVFNVFGIMGIATAISNLVPLKAGGMANDGYNIFIDLPKSPRSRGAMCTLLRTNALLTDLESTNDLPENIKSHIMNADYSDLSDVSVANMLCYKNTILIDNGRYDEAIENYQRLADDEDVLGIFKNEAKCELVYFEIMGECNAEKIDSLMDKKLTEYIKATSVYPSRKRLMYAYYLIYKKEKEKADKEYEAFLKACENSPTRIDAVIEQREMERVRSKYENM